MEKNNPQSFFLRLCMVAVAIMTAVVVFAQDVRMGRYEQLKSMRGKDLVMLGLKYLNERNMPDSALLCFTLQANKRFETEDKDFEEIGACANALKLLGTVYSDWYYDYQKSYGFLYLAEQYSIKHKYFITLPGIHNEMAALDVMKVGFSNQDKGNNEIINKFKTAFHEALRYGDHEGVGYITANLAGRGLSYNLIDSVKEELITYCSMKKESESSQKETQFVCEAILKFNDKHYEEALSLMNHALSNTYNDNIHFKANDSINTLCIKAEMLTAMKRNEEALATYHKILEIAKRTINHVGIMDAYKGLFDSYKEQGNDALAAKYELLYLREKDFIVNKSKLADMEQTKFLLEIDELNKEAEAMAMRDRMKSRILWMVSAFTLLIVCLLIFLYLKYKQVKENHRLLYLKSLDMIRTDEEKRQLIEKLEAQIRQYEELEKKEAAHEVHRMDEEKMTNLLHRIFMVMETSEEVYSKDFSMNRLAELVGDTRNNVSEAINRQYKTGFHDLVNEYRVKEACRRMNDIEHYGHLTIEYISSELGFKSRTTFIAAFKKMVGLTPSAYLKLAKER